MNTISTPIRVSAIATALAMLGIQLIAAYEATQGGTLYTMVSAMAACIVLAVLPIFIEAARRSGAYVIAVAQFVAFGAFLAYSLPATVGRTGEVKEVQAAEAVQATNEAARIRQDYQTTQALVTEAEVWVARECRTGKGPKCDGASFVLRQRQASMKDLGEQLSASSPPVGDIGSETLSWASKGFLAPETIRKASGLCFALGLDVIIWSLIWLAATSGRELEAITERQEPLTDPEIEELRRVLGGQRRPLNNGQLAARMGVSPAEASKRVTDAVAAGLVSRTKLGREVQVSLLN